MNAALKAAAPTRKQLAALLNSLATPSADGHLTTSSVQKLNNVRARLHHARNQVKAIGLHSSARADVLIIINGTDAIFANLIAISTTDNQATVQRLASQTKRQQQRIKAAQKRVAPVLRQR
jgi:hypothetical protein